MDGIENHVDDYPILCRPPIVKTFRTSQLPVRNEANPGRASAGLPRGPVGRRGQDGLIAGAQFRASGPTSSVQTTNFCSRVVPKEVVAVAAALFAASSRREVVAVADAAEESRWAVAGRREGLRL